MLPDRVSNPGPLTYESGALPIALCSPAIQASQSQIMEFRKAEIRKTKDQAESVWSKGNKTMEKELAMYSEFLQGLSLI